MGSFAADVTTGSRKHSQAEPGANSSDDDDSGHDGSDGGSDDFGEVLLLLHSWSSHCLHADRPRAPPSAQR